MTRATLQPPLTTGSLEPSVIPRLLTKELIVLHYVPIGVRTLEKWISTGDFPGPDLRHGAKLVFWRRETVDVWFEKYCEEHRAKE